MFAKKIPTQTSGIVIPGKWVPNLGSLKINRGSTFQLKQGIVFSSKSAGSLTELVVLSLILLVFFLKKGKSKRESFYLINVSALISFLYPGKKLSVMDEQHSHN